MKWSRLDEEVLMILEFGFKIARIFPPTSFKAVSFVKLANGPYCFNSQHTPGI